jgi:pSer/pThr/pTyr-binding forkhead associated (FHA) protein
MNLDYSQPVPLRLQMTALDDPQARVFRYEFDADRSQILLGRRGGVDVLLPHAKVSLVHARIERRGNEYLLVDDGSTNGTRLNGLRVPTGQRMVLRDGDRIGIGDFALLVAIADVDGDWPSDSSKSIARTMVREVLERLGSGESLPSLVVVDGPQSGARLTLTDVGRTFLLGRAEGSNELRLDAIDMWREHVALVRDDEGVTVRDLGAGATLTVNGERVSGARLLHDGDTLALGGTTLRFADPAEVYLHKLEASTTPDETEPGAATASKERGRPELLMIIVGMVAAVAAGAGLLYVLLW